MSGAWVLVCGPSGAGKDTVIAQARAQLSPAADIVFARRLITRPAHPASDHLPIERAEFARRCAAGEFALHWQANGFDYAIPADYARQVAAGRTVVVNGSRAHLAALRAEGQAVGGRWCAVLIVAPPAVLQARLMARRREDDATIVARMARNEWLREVAAAVTIVNDGDPAAAGAQLAAAIRACAAQTAPAPPPR